MNPLKATPIILATSAMFTGSHLLAQSDMLPVSRTTGVQTQKLLRGKSTLLALTNVRILTAGTVTAVSGSDLTLSGSPALSTLATGPKAIKIISRVNHKAGSTNAYGYSAKITAVAGEVATVALPVAPNVGDEFVVYQLNTIASVLGSTNTYGLNSGTTAAVSDIVYLTNEGSLVGYFYRSDVSNWRLVSDPDGANQGDTVIEPSAGVMLTRRSTGTPEIFIRLSGEALPGKQVAKIGGSGYSIVNNPFLIPTTLAESGLSTSLNGGTGPGTADVLYLEEEGILTGYYYKTAGLGGSGWRALGDATTDRSGVIIKPGKALLLKDQVGTAGFVLAEPFAE